MNDFNQRFGLHLKKMQTIQKYILDSIEDETQETLEKLIKYIKDHNCAEKRCELNSILHLINNISNKHHRTTSFFSKFEKLLLILKDNTMQTFTNSEIFFIFQENKRLLLFFFFLKKKFLFLKNSCLLCFQSPQIWLLFIHNIFALYLSHILTNS